MNNGEINAVIVAEKFAALKSGFLRGNHKVWGKSLLEWVSLSLGTIPYRIAETESPDELLSEIKRVADDGSEITVVLFSDTPLIKAETVQSAINTLTEECEDAVRMTRGYVFRTEYLMGLDSLDGIKTYFFDEEDFITASDYKQLSLISDFLRNRILDYHMKNGVYIMDTGSVYIDSDCVIGCGTVIHPGNHLCGSCKIADDVILKPGNMLKNAEISGGAVIWSSTIEDSTVGSRTTVGPYAYIRGGAKVGEDCRVGDYVEIKNSQIGNGTKMAHLTYVGDARIGEKCNLGCGVIFANYDGKNKSKTVVGDRVFIGSNCNLVAPVTVESGAFIAAGTTVTEDVPEGSLAIGRSRQHIKEDYDSKYRP